MGLYVAPGSSGFAEIVNSDYVDMTGMIALVNQTVGTTNKLTCVSRPRRFGKSYAAKMLCAYYDSSCDSHALFDDKEIAKTPDYEKHLNQYNVIYLDITGFISSAQIEGTSLKEVPNMIVKAVCDELNETYLRISPFNDIDEALTASVEATGGKRFVFIIDEWDAMIREAKNDPEAQKRYFNLLRGLFKNANLTPKVVAAAYMTGILPIKKDGSQSAISDFKEYSVLYPGKFAKYTGFVESDVINLCRNNDMSFEEVRAWYDGYDFSGSGAVYNPYSVMRAMEERSCRSYWKETSAAESLKTYINMDLEGMQEVISRLITGEEIEVDVSDFRNDFETFGSKDDVITLLIHLGYLTFNNKTHTARIPNEEVRSEFRGILKGKGVNHKWLELIKRSQKLLNDTLAGNADNVAAAIDEIRKENYAPQFYNNEQSLRSIIKFAYIAAYDSYVKIEELASGKGLADIVMLPKRGSELPALVIELKWNKSAEGALSQIKDKSYPVILKDFGGEILLVGVNYDAKSGKHSCVIEKI